MNAERNVQDGAWDARDRTMYSVNSTPHASANRRKAAAFALEEIS